MPRMTDQLQIKNKTADFKSMATGQYHRLCEKDQHCIQFSFETSLLTLQCTYTSV